MNKTYLIIPFEKFKEEIGKQMIEANNLHEKQIFNSQELDLLTEELKKWQNETLNILEKSFNVPDNEYFNDFNSVTGKIYDYGTNKVLQQLINDQKNIIADKQRFLWDTLRLIEVLDAVTKYNIIDLKAREKYLIEDKLELLLDKLYELYDDSYYPVRIILEGNGIILKRYDDDRELANVLESNGYIKLFGTFEGVNARLTANGAIYVESKKKTFKETYDDINKSQEEMNSKIDEIIYHLKKTGLGQEIIFNEIQELGDLYSKLTKKNWGQIVKGKLVDLALAKLIEKDTLDYIYNALTTHSMRLP